MCWDLVKFVSQLTFYSSNKLYPEAGASIRCKNWGCSNGYTDTLKPETLFCLPHPLSHFHSLSPPPPSQSHIPYSSPLLRSPLLHLVCPLRSQVSGSRVADAWSLRVSPELPPPLEKLSKFNVRFRAFWSILSISTTKWRLCSFRFWIHRPKFWGCWNTPNTNGSFGSSELFILSSWLNQVLDLVRPVQNYAISLSLSLWTPTTTIQTFYATQHKSHYNSFCMSVTIRTTEQIHKELPGWLYFIIN